MPKPVMSVVNVEDVDSNQYFYAYVSTDNFRVRITPDDNEMISPVVESLTDANILVDYYENVAKALGFDFVVEKPVLDLISEFEEDAKHL